MTETAEPAPPVHLNAPEPAANLPRPRRPRGVQSTVQAATLQAFAFDAAKALRKSLTKDGELSVAREDAQALAMLVKAWDTAADRLRVLKGKGLPASVRAKTSSSAGPVEPLNPA